MDNTNIPSFEETLKTSLMMSLDAEVINEIVKKQMEIGINKIIQDMLGYNGDLSNVIKNKVRSVMIPAIENHDFNQYLVKLDCVLTELFNQTSIKENKVILDNFKDLLSDHIPRTMNIQDIFDVWCKHVAENVSTTNLEARHDDDEPYYEPIDVQMEFNIDRGCDWSSYDWGGIAFICKHDSDMNREVRVYREKKKPESEWRLSSGNPHLEIRSLRYMKEFDILVERIYRNSVGITIDHDELDAEVEPNEKPEYSLS